MKFRAHSTFYLRKGWLHKGIKEIKKNPKVFWDKSINPMDEFGIGSNMVSSLRYWMQATGIAEEFFENKSRAMRLTPIGEVIWEHDPYFEEDGTWFYIQYMLASNKNMATSWYYFFNEYNVPVIEKEDFINSLKIFVEESGEKLSADKSFNDDFDCVVKTYDASNELIEPESNFICPLSSLNLLKRDSKGILRKTSPHKDAIHPLIILAVILQSDLIDNDTRQIKISSIEKGTNNIGRVFNLDNIAVADYLDKLQNLGYVKVQRTAGMDVVNIKTNITAIDCLTNYYEAIK